MIPALNPHDLTFYQEALEEAKCGLEEGGIPVGAVLVCDNQILGKGHNRRVQRGSSILHAEMDAIENAGRITPLQYRRSTLYTTLSPCPMCAGIARLYKIPRIVIGENCNYCGDESSLVRSEVEVVILKDLTSIDLLASYIKRNPGVWDEDLGELNSLKSLE